MKITFSTKATKKKKKKRSIRLIKHQNEKDTWLSIIVSLELAWASYGGTFHDNFGKLAELESRKLSFFLHPPSLTFSLPRPAGYNRPLSAANPPKSDPISGLAWFAKPFRGWSPSPPFPCPFPCGSSFPKFSWLHARGGREVGAFATQDGEQRNHPIPIPRPIMSQRRAVLTHALGDFCSLIPFRLLVVDDVVARIVLLPCVLRLPFLSSSSLFFSPFLFPSLLLFQWPVSPPPPSPRSWFFVLLFLGTDAWTTRLFFSGRRMSRMVVYL